MSLMLCVPLDWQYAELPSSASDAVLCSFVRCGTSKQIEKKKKKKKLLKYFIVVYIKPISMNHPDNFF